MSAGLVLCSTHALATSTFFNVSASGTTLTINTTIPNHIYTNAGIKINSPGNFSPASGCTMQSNGYCTFSVSNTSSATIPINGSTATMNFSLCLNGLGPLSCQSYSVGLNGPLYYASTTYGYVYQSTNMGVTWTRLGTQPGGNSNYGMTLSNDTLYLGGSNGDVEKSTDYGDSWAPTGAQPDGSQILSTWVLDSTHMYAGTAEGNVAVSYNGGETWTLLTPPSNSFPTPPDADPYNTIVAQSSSVLYDTIQVGGGGDSFIYKSTDGGTTWSNITPSYPDPSATPYSGFTYLNGTLYAITSGSGQSLTFYTSNGGSSWAQVGSTSVGYIIPNQLIAESGPPVSLYGTREGDIQYSTDNGLNWTTLTVGGSETFYSLAKNENLFYLGGVTGDLKTYNTVTDEWRTLPVQPGGSLPYGLFISGSTIYVGSSTGRLESSTDLGNTWSYNAGLSSINTNYAQLYRVLMSGSDYYAGDNSGSLFYSTNAGTSWSKNENGPGALLSLFVVPGAPNSTFYTGTYNNRIYKMTGPDGT